MSASLTRSQRTVPTLAASSLVVRGGMLALLSVSDKRGLIPFAQSLTKLGYTLLGTGGTYAALAEAGLAATKVGAYTKSDEILGGRVKTLHPLIHGGLLGRPSLDSDAREMARHGISPIQILAVNLYPFRETITKGGTRADAIENIDIGGPAMIRAAAKNADEVAVAVDPEDYPAIIAELEATGSISQGTRRRLQLKAFRHTASYDAAIAAYLGAEDADLFPSELTLGLTRVQSLRYGENPHQRAALYRFGTPTVSVTAAAQLQGKELSYNNLLDLDAALGVLLEFPEAATAVVVKHTTPCGVASGADVTATYLTARGIDEVSAFGGIVAINRVIDASCARALAETFLEAVVAPSFSSEALQILGAKKNLRLLAAGDALRTCTTPPLQLDFRSISGGMLAMERDAAEPPGDWTFPTKRKPTAEELAAGHYAWRIVKHVKSNAIAFASATQLLAQGGGQTSRIDSVNIAVRRGGDKLRGSAAASDAFFPFRDGLDAIAAAGATFVVQPGGSVRDDEVIAAADEHGIAMAMTSVRHFRH